MSARACGGPPRATARAATLALAAVLAAAGDARAHVNSPDLVHEGLAGPYRLLVTIRPPDVIPGVAAIDVLATRADLGTVTLVPLPMRGPGRSRRRSPTSPRAAPRTRAGSRAGCG